MGTCVLKCPYSKKIKSYWINIQSLIIVDLGIEVKTKKHNSFLGKVQAIKHKAYNLLIYLVDAGWKFQEKVPTDFRKSFVDGQPIAEVFQAMCEGLNVDFAYSLGDYEDYTFSQNGYTIDGDGARIEEVPNVYEAITGIKKASTNTTTAQAITSTTSNTSTTTSNTQNSTTGSSNSGTNNNSVSSNSSNLNNSTLNTSTATVGRPSSTANTVEGATTNNVVNQQANKEDVEKKRKKLKKEFKKKFEKLFVGDGISRKTDICDDTFDYDRITVEPQAVASTASTTPTTATATSTTATTATAGTSTAIQGTTGSSVAQTTNTTTGNNASATGTTGNNASASGSTTGGTIGTTGAASGAGIITATGCSTCACHCGTYGQMAQHSYQNYCPQCKKSGTLIVHTASGNSGEATSDSEISCRGSGGCGADYCINCGGDKGGSDTCNDPAKKLTPAGGSTGSTSSTGGGEVVDIEDKSFYGLISQICSSTDSIFIIANNIAYLITFKELFGLEDEYEKKNPKVKIVENDSFQEQHSNQGYYNAVEVKSEDGKVRLQYDSLVNLYGKIEKKYDLQKLEEEAEANNATTTNSSNTTGTTSNTTQTITNPNVVQTQSSSTNKKKDDKDDDEDSDDINLNAKAMALLSALVRDYGNKYRARVLYDPHISQGSFIKFTNPNTKKEERFFVQGYTVHYNKNNVLMQDINFKFGPDTPEAPTTATTSGGGSSGGITGGNGDINSLMQQACTQYQFHHNCSTASCFQSAGGGDCYAWSGWLYNQAKAGGATVRIIQTTSTVASSGTHRTVQYSQDGGTSWIDFPYKECGCTNGQQVITGKPGCFVCCDQNGTGDCSNILN